MRVIWRSAPLMLVLSAGLIGCQGGDSDQDTADPSLPRVTIKVPGMF
jgi:hypothetical protein